MMNKRKQTLLALKYKVISKLTKSESLRLGFNDDYSLGKIDGKEFAYEQVLDLIEEMIDEN